MQGVGLARLRATAERLRAAATYERWAQARRAPVDQNLVLYEAFGGNGMLCNPEAIFRGLLAAPDMQHLRHVWVLTDPGEFPQTVAEFAGDDRVRFVGRGSAEYERALSRAKYVVNNATFPEQFGKRDGQIYLNTWHGTPLKAMGYDIPDGVLDTRNVVRNFLAADYLLAPNAITAEMYLSAYRMRNVFQGAVIEQGTPRIDRQFCSAEQRRLIRDRLVARGLDLRDEQQIVLYAPTLKGSFYTPDNDVAALAELVGALTQRLDPDRHRVLLKVHQRVYRHALDRPDIRPFLVPNDLPTNDVLAVTDTLITDYSSTFIDYLASGRPVLFYAPDMAEYLESRGAFTIPVAEWPGPVCTDVDELARWLGGIGSGGAHDPQAGYAERYRAAREQLVAGEDGKATERVIDIVFRGNPTGLPLRRADTDGRTTVLMHLGALLPNGITSSALALLDSIDHERFDVSVTFPLPKRAERVAVVQRLHPSVRVLPRFGAINGFRPRTRALLAVRWRTAAQHRRSVERGRGPLRDEWVRCFGDSRFDHVVDFSGYAPFWIKLFTARRGGTLSVWQHNDMLAESTSPGRSEWLRASLKAVFALYRYADRIVSVAEPLTAINEASLRRYAPQATFTFAHNTINVERIHRLAYGPEPGAAATIPVSGGLRAALQGLVARYGPRTVRAEIAAVATAAEVLPARPGGVRTFITAGRLSAEKNHERLIRAFHLVKADFPETRLVILGRGGLRAELQGLIRDLGLEQSVVLAGQQANPYVLFAAADCFVMSSDYEGQGIVLLEAQVLGLPIVTTAFGAVRGALAEGHGRVVPLTVEDLAEGMRAFLRGEVAAAPFDAEEYNRRALAEFYRAIGAAS